MAFYERSKFTGAKVFKWNQTLPEDTIPPGVGLLILLIKYVFIGVKRIRPGTKDVTYKTVQKSLCFNLEDLLSRDNMESLVLKALELEPKLQDDVAYLTSKITHHLVSNFDFSGLTTLSSNNTVIIVNIYRPVIFLWHQAEGVVKGDKNFVYGVEDIVFSLRTSLNVKIGSDDLVEVPALAMFEMCDGGGGVSEEYTCAICLKELLGNQRRGIKKTSCSHVFHGACLASWLWRKQSCPMCRLQLP